MTSIPASAAAPPIEVDAVDLPASARAVDAPALTVDVPSFASRWWIIPLMLLTDWVALELALGAGMGLRQLLVDVAPIGLSLDRHYWPLAKGVLIVPLGFLLAGLYAGLGISMVERFRRRAFTLVLLFGVLLVWNDWVLAGRWPRGVLLGAMAFALILSPLMESMLRHTLIRLGCWGQPAVVLGVARTGQRLIRTLKRNPELGLVPVAAFDDDPTTWGTSVEGVLVVGPLAHARKFAGSVHIALVAMPGAGGSRLTKLCERLQFPRVILVPDLMEMASLWVRSRDLMGILGLEVKKNLLQRQNWLLKRTLDYALAVPLALLSLPVIALLAAWIRLLDGGPAFYRQPRVGLGGRTIGIWKLRTMYRDADRLLADHLDADPVARAQWERQCKLYPDPRLLPVIGPLLRRTSLDELPQLWNVLTGDMSLVGPRPLPHYHLDRFEADFRSLRRRVLPGLTGLWQVCERGSADLAMQRSYDTYYIRNWSWWLDLYLLSRTVWAVIRGRGAY